jgi:UDP:flavonoid glycosyltransferase YjiC (YdhE family)
LEEFIGGESGFIYVAMGTSKLASQMPKSLRDLFLNVFEKLPYRVLWKFEGSIDKKDLPLNVKISSWFPQQDILGHKKILAYVSHGGVLSTFETVFHGVPAVLIPVCFDQDIVAEKARLDGYGKKSSFVTVAAKLSGFLSIQTAVGRFDFR